MHALGVILPHQTGEDVAQKTLKAAREADNLLGQSHKVTKYAQLMTDEGQPHRGGRPLVAQEATHLVGIQLLFNRKID